MTGAADFRVICEIASPTRPDLSGVRAQVDALRDVADSFIVTDNHMGRAAMSSLAVAAEVQRHGGDAIACLNARDRNLLGLRRDLLTATADGVDEILLVHGDAPSVGERATGLTVRAMLDEVRAFSARVAPLPITKAGVTSRLGNLPTWKQDADALFVQVAFDADELVAWRRSIAFGGPVYAGVLVVTSAALAAKLSAEVPQLRVPDDWINAIDRDPTNGLKLALELTGAIRESTAFDGVHLIPVGTYRALADAWE